MYLECMNEKIFLYIIQIAEGSEEKEIEKNKSHINFYAIIY